MQTNISNKQYQQDYGYSGIYFINILIIKEYFINLIILIINFRCI